MRRMIASAKKAIHRNKLQTDSQQTSPQQTDWHGNDLFDILGGDPVPIDRSLFDQNVRDLSISSTGPPGGYTCWDDTQCGLCSCFQDPLFISTLFTKKSKQVGNVSDLLAWSRAGSGCPLCTYISLQFIMTIKESENGQLPMNAYFSVGWETEDSEDERYQNFAVSYLVFNIRWGFPQGKQKQYSLNCFTNEGRLISYNMHYDFDLFSICRSENGVLRAHTSAKSGH